VVEISIAMLARNRFIGGTYHIKGLFFRPKF